MNQFDKDFDSFNRMFKVIWWTAFGFIALVFVAIFGVYAGGAWLAYQNKDRAIHIVDKLEQRFLPDDGGAP